MPRTAMLKIGTPRRRKPLSKMTATSAPRSSWSTNSTIEWPPVSSSPSQAKRTLIGSFPSARSCDAASRSIQSWPLSSATPRAYSHSSRTVGSNGSVVQSSSGVGGCTSKCP